MHKPLRVALLLFLLSNVQARAFTLETAFTDGCHERISIEAIRAAGWGAQPPSIDAADRVLVANLPFTLPDDWDPWMVSLLIGLRDNDLHGGLVTDLVQHPWLDYSDSDQGTHCLRASGHDGVPGDADAMAACQDWVRKQLELAMAASPGQLETVRVGLKFQTTEVQVASRPFHLGKAIHAIQDSFSHTFRSPDFKQVFGVFNYVDPALASDYKEVRDGHPHSSTLDRCDGESDFDRARVQAAVSASADLLRLAQGSSSVQAQGLSVSGPGSWFPWLESAPGCSADNGWCEAVARYEAAERAVGCSSAPTAVMAWTLCFVALPLLRRRRDSR